MMRTRSRRAHAAMRATCSAVLGWARLWRSGNASTGTRSAANSSTSAPPSWKAATSGRQRARSSRRVCSIICRSVPPGFRQSSSWRTASAMRALARDFDRREARRAVEKRPLPQLEHQQRPQLQRVIAAAGEVLGGDGVDGARVEQAALAGARVAQDGARRLAQRAAEPVDDRHAEATFAAMQYLVGDQAAHRALEQPLALAAADLEARR